MAYVGWAAMYIDSHAHLFLKDYPSDREDAIARARQSGVDRIIIPGTNASTSREAVGLAAQHPFIHACIGVHPHEASEVTEKEWDELEELSGVAGVVAIGEIGLDYHYDFSPKQTQKDVFQRQLDLAVRKNLPVVVHTRESMDDAIEAVSNTVKKSAGWRPQSGRGVFHCFTGTVDQAEQLFALGFYVSFPGIVTFKNSPVVETIRQIGLARVLLETDSPYMTPVPHRGKRNEPAFVSLVAETIARILNCDVKTVAAETTRNTMALFSLENHV